MGQNQTASWDEWFRAYEEVYRHLPGAAHINCPNCGQDALRLVFVGDIAEGSGYAYFWCDHCRFGIPLSRVPLPSGVEVLPRGMSADELSSHVPSFSFVSADP